MDANEILQEYIHAVMNEPPGASREWLISSDDGPFYGEKAHHRWKLDNVEEAKKILQQLYQDQGDNSFIAEVKASKKTVGFKSGVPLYFRTWIEAEPEPGPC